MPNAEHDNSPGPSHNTILANSNVATRLPATDLARARRFYSEKLGLEPAEQRPGGLLYRCASGCFALFESAGSASGTHTQMAWEVDDIEVAVAVLRKRGVIFEEYDLPGLTTVKGIATVEGNYPSKGVGERAAWFRDSEGNLLGFGQPVRAWNERSAVRHITISSPDGESMNRTR
jgi:catechol 2,3-dioxygenase-like lactoylglutathione lyase family enzyme